ncbi:MAG: proton-translocating NADH-quinone oxidoreductase subunit M [Planctomycetota bacterium]|nr:MAG: proton-translocating NADH-quinone oxidoreductase subunit M [Planctomycetota bacterium]
MSTESLVLLATIFLPLMGVGLVWAVAPSGRSVVRYVALAVSLATLAGAAWLVARFPAEGIAEGTEAFATVNAPWLGTASGIDIRFHVALDGLSLWLFALSALLTATSVLVSWTAITERVSEFFAMLLLLETGMLGVFAAQDIILFYVFFEFTLIPLFFLIGIWGSEERRYAAIKFFLFTLAGSMLTFLGILAIVLNARGVGGELTFSIPELTARLAANPLGFDLQLLIFVALFAGFAIKVPLFPFHTWLPLAHVQAPTAGSVILAGVLLKMGTYGFLRFSLPMLPDATAAAMPWMLWLSVAGIVYGALVALAQGDMKRLIAYSSVSHLGYCMLGLFALNRLGMQGGVLQTINHGLSTGGLFAIVGMVYERYHTRQIGEFGGLAKRTPLLATMMVFFTFSSIGLPGLNGFVGETLVLVGMFQRGWADVDAAGPPAGLAGQYQWISVLAVTGVVLGAWYMLWLVQRVFFGPLKEPHGHDAPGGHGDGQGAIQDMNLREIAALAPLCAFILWIGIYPQFFLDRMSDQLDTITDRGAAALERHEAREAIEVRMASESRR